MTDPCQSLLRKWQQLYGVVGFSQENLDWASFLGNDAYGVLKVIPKWTKGSPIQNVDDLLKALNGIATESFTPGSETIVPFFSPQEAQVVMALWQKNVQLSPGVFAVPPTTKVNCQTIPIIINTPNEGLAAALSQFQMAAPEASSEEDSSAEDSDEDSEDEDDNILTIPPVVNFGGGASTMPTFNTNFPPVGTNPPNMSGGTAASAWNGLTMPTFNGALVAPSGATMAGAGSQFQPAPNMAAPPNFGFNGPTAVGQPIVEGADMPYATVVVRGLQDATESKIFIISVPNPTPADPNAKFRVEIFASAGKAPTTMILTKFADDDESGKADNAQKHKIHTDNKRRLKDNKMASPSVTETGTVIIPLGLSNGEDEAGVCAQKVELYVASPAASAAMQCKPESNKAKSSSRVQALPSFNAGPTAPGPMSGNFPTGVTSGQTSGPTSGANNASNTQIPIQDSSNEQVPQGAVPMRIYQFKKNPQNYPMYITMALPVYPRVVAKDPGNTGSYWIQKVQNGPIFKSGTRFPPYKLTEIASRYTNQQAIANDLIRLVSASGAPQQQNSGQNSNGALASLVATNAPLNTGLSSMMGGMAAPQQQNAGLVGLLAGQNTMGGGLLNNTGLAGAPGVQPVTSNNQYTGMAVPQAGGMMGGQSASATGLGLPTFNPQQNFGLAGATQAPPPAQATQQGGLQFQQVGGARGGLLPGVPSFSLNQQPNGATTQANPPAMQTQTGFPQNTGIPQMVPANQPAQQPTGNFVPGMTQMQSAGGMYQNPQQNQLGQAAMGGQQVPATQAQNTMLQGTATVQPPNALAQALTQNTGMNLTGQMAVPQNTAQPQFPNLGLQPLQGTATPQQILGGNQQTGMVLPTQGTGMNLAAMLGTQTQ